MQRLTAWFVPLVLVGCLASRPSSLRAESPDFAGTHDAAAPLTLGAPTSGTLSSAADVDYLWFNGVAGAFYSVGLSQSGFGLPLECVLTDANDNSLGAEGLQSIFRADGSGRFHVRLSGPPWLTFPVSYVLNVQAFPVTPQSVGPLIQGQLASQYEVDGYVWTFDSPPPGTTYALLGSDNVKTSYRLGVGSTAQLFSGEPAFLDPVPGASLRVTTQCAYGNTSASYKLRLQRLTPTPMTNDQVSGQFMQGPEIHAYSRDLAPDQPYGVWVTVGNTIPGGFDLDLAIRDGNGTPVSPSPPYLPSSFVSSPEGGIHQFYLSSGQSSASPYVLHVQPMADDYPDDVGWDEWYETNQIPINTFRAGLLEVPSDVDVFWFEPQPGQTYAVQAPQLAQGRVRLDVDSGWPRETCFTATNSDPVPIRLERGGSDLWTGALPYQVHVRSFTDDNDNTRAGARVLNVGGLPVAGDLKVPGDVDVFSFTLLAGQRYTFQAGAGKRYIIVHENSPSQYESIDGTGSEFAFTARYFGQHYGYVQALDGGTGAYSVSVSRGLVQPRPDFSISSVILAPDLAASSPVSLAQSSPGQKLTAYVQVRNRGSRTSAAGYLGLYMDQPAEATASTPGARKIAVGTLGAYTSKMIKVPGLVVPTNGLGGKVFRAFIDCTAVIGELDEGNNQRTVGYQSVAGRADFAVTGISWSPTRPTPGGSLTAYVTVRNQGTLAGNAGYLALFTNQTATVSAPTSTARRVVAGILLPTQVKTYTFAGLKAPLAVTNFAGPGPITPPVPVADLPLLAFVDCLDTATNEVDEGNNQLLTHCTVEQKYIDFVIGAIELTPAQPVAGELFTAVVSVRNTGTWSGNAGKAGIWLNAAAPVTNGATPAMSVVVGPLLPGQVKNFTFAGLRAPTNGAHVFRAAVNLAGLDAAVPFESDRSNNQKSHSYNVLQRYVDFVVSSLSLSVGEVEVGKTFTAYALVRNLGTVAGDAGYLDVWTTNTTGKAIQSKPALIIKGDGASKYVIFTSLPAPRVAGIYTFRAMIDARTNRIERVETNNTRTVDYEVYSN